ncbi:protein NETWORKED 2D-like isoform X2 [Lotus japonicus]|uniref:protein NETWORKED 2D-like isoform X1 n=1 Tax=Lotus japonicus TaxID=34305 RepID=UPI002588D21E|nr:protein NETWORKED 2D-like isoform X1 [Lotus japonicus]XP_057419788.1 protein NETWORKED 2D-like isoform X2 [Lotus japonicus]
MLQRAASNAYSWWWASHIRTKQSKWMEQNLQDMEEKVQSVLKLLEEEGDSFAKRAEMYYKRRPELINFVEESFRAYRSLADRYDHISTELQNANNTIASVCPDQVPYMDDDDDIASPRTPRKMAKGFSPNIPKVPKPPLKDLKSVITTATKKLNPKKFATTTPAPKVPKSGLSRKEALQEIDKLQKQILSLQTVKEFVKSTYDNAIARYWETENQIKELQERVSNLQDELGEGVVIDDDEARRLMTEAALKSCQEALSKLEEKQTVSLDETRIESTRVKEVKAKLRSLMDAFQYDQTNPKEPRAKRDVKEVTKTKDLGEDADKTSQQRQDLQLLQEKIKEHFEAGSSSGLTVMEMAEKIDDLVNKVISLETAVSSQAAHVKRLKIETDELHSLVQALESDKESLTNDKVKLNEQLREMDEKVYAVQDLNQVVEDQNSNLQTHFTEAHCSLDHLSAKVQTVKPDDEAEVREIPPTERNSSREVESEHDLKRHDVLNQDNVLLYNVKTGEELQATGLVEDTVNSDKELKVAGVVEDDVVMSDEKLKVTGSLENETKVTASPKMEEGTTVENESPIGSKEREKTKDTGLSDIVKSTNALSITAGNEESSGNSINNNQSLLPLGEDSSIKHQENDSKKMHSETKTTPKGADESDQRQLFMNGVQDTEKVLLSEYNNTLRNYENVKNKLIEVEKRNQDTIFESSLQMKELKTANALKDEEIRLLRQKLGFLQKTLEGNEDLRELTSVQPPEKHDIDEVLKIEEPEPTSAIEEKFRTSIDELLEENLEFWLRFSTSFTEIQKFESTIKDLLIEEKKIEEKLKSSEGSSSIKYSLKSDARPLYKHLAEIQNELTGWLENSAMLKEDLQCRFSSLCEIQEEITSALNLSAEGDHFNFTSHQAAKFQGEVLNMKQENHRVADELQAGLDLITTLQLDVEKALAKLDERFGLSNSKRSQLRPAESRNRIPLRSFIFGVKPKKQKQSIFSCMTPGMHRKYRASRG